MNTEAWKERGRQTGGKPLVANGFSVAHTLLGTHVLALAWNLQVIKFMKKG